MRSEKEGLKKKAMKSTCDDRKTRMDRLATPSTSEKMMRQVTSRMTSMMRWSFFTAVLVSFSDRASARRSWYTVTCTSTATWLLIFLFQMDIIHHTLLTGSL